MSHRQIFIVISVLLVALVGCGRTTDFDKCDLEKGRFIKGKHYIASKFLNEERQWNYQEWNKYQTRKARYIADEKCSLAELELRVKIKRNATLATTQSSGIKSNLSDSTKSFETQVEDFEETIDLTR